MTDSQPRSAAAAANVEQSAAHLARSATAVEHSADRNTILAEDRTVLAAERTYAAWVRTGLAALASGAGAKALLGGILPGWCRTLIATLLVLFSMFCLLAAVWRELTPRATPFADIRRVPAAGLILINGCLLLVAAAVLAGVWFASG